MRQTIWESGLSTGPNITGPDHKFLNLSGNWKKIA